MKNAAESDRPPLTYVRLGTHIRDVTQVASPSQIYAAIDLPTIIYGPMQRMKTKCFVEPAIASTAVFVL